MSEPLAATNGHRNFLDEYRLSPFPSVVFLRKGRLPGSCFPGVRPGLLAFFPGRKPRITPPLGRIKFFPMAPSSPSWDGSHSRKIAAVPPPRAYKASPDRRPSTQQPRFFFPFQTRRRFLQFKGPDPPPSICRALREEDPPLPHGTGPPLPSYISFNTNPFFFFRDYVSFYGK